MVGVGATDLEAVGGPRDDVATVAAGDAHRLGQLELGHGGIKLDAAGFLQHFHELAAAAIADGWLVGVDLDQRIVDAAAAHGGEQVLDGVDLDAAFAEGGGALDLLDVVDVRVDGWLVGQVDALEDVAGVGRRGFDGERDVVPGVERGAVNGLGFADSGLFKAGHGKRTP